MPFFTLKPLTASLLPQQTLPTCDLRCGFCWRPQAHHPANDQQTPYRFSLHPPQAGFSNLPSAPAPTPGQSRMLPRLAFLTFRLHPPLLARAPLTTSWLFCSQISLLGPFLRQFPCILLFPSHFPSSSHCILIYNFIHVLSSLLPH